MRSIYVNKVDSAGNASIGNLLIGVLLTGLLIAGILVYLAFASYRQGTVREMAEADARRISHLVFEHLYTVMRHGSSRDEIDDAIHHMQAQLPGYEIGVIRGEPVVRQFGDRAGHQALRSNDPGVAAVIGNGEVHYTFDHDGLRYLFPAKVSSECQKCHSTANIGEVNGVISVRVPIAELEGPIDRIAYPVLYLVLGLFTTLLLASFLVLRSRVSRPIAELDQHVSELSEAADYSRSLRVREFWPREVLSLARSFNELMDQVRSSHRQLRENSLRDPLTGLFNRRHFDDVLSQAVTDALQGSLPFSVLLIDLDRFKPINDYYGHAAGDAVLVSVAEALRQTVRETDVAARIGGDEFGILALGADKAAATELAERIRTAVENSQLRFGSDFVQPACSIGSSSFGEDGQRASDLLLLADKLMFADKARRGGGR